MDNPKQGKFSTHLIQAINNLLWPSVCINCRTNIAEQDENFCRKCWSILSESSIGSYCHRCGCDASEYGLIANACPACQQQQFNFEQIARAGVYTGPLKNMILTFKNSNVRLTQILTKLASDAFNTAPFRDNIDYFVPVPLHWKRHLSRGYNQSLLIAKELARQKSKLNTDLVRIRNTPKQLSMRTPAQKTKNVAGAFAVRKNHNFKGKKICLVDDIKTTGATLNECAKILNQAGAKRIYAMVLAVAGQIKN
jgi:ComF family protein